MVKKMYIAICILFIITCGMAAQVSPTAGPGKFPASGTPSPASIDTPANGSVIHAYAPTTFYKNVSGYVNGAWLQVQYPNAVIREFPASMAFAGGWTNLSSVVAINSTGDFGYRFINASSFVTPWSTFSVIHNMQLVSESSLATAWVFFPSTTGWTNLYAANFSSQAWSLTPSSGLYSIYTPWRNIGADSYVWSHGSFANTNYGSAAELKVFSEGTTARAYVATGHGAYLDTNCSQSTYELYMYNLYYNQYNPFFDLNVSKTTVFDESTITWNTAPAIGNYLANLAYSPTINQYYTFTINNRTDYLALTTIQQGWSQDFFAYSRETGNPPQVWQVLGKQGNATALLYAQTNTTETLALDSPVFPAINLQVGDRIVVTYNSTSDHQLNFNLKHGGSTVNALVLSSGENHYYATQNKTYLVTSAITLDQLEFSGMFDAGNNLQIVNISIERPTTYSSYQVPAYAIANESLPPSTYTLYVFAHADLVLTQVFTISGFETGQIVITYSPTTGGQRIVNFFTPSGDMLDFYQFRCSLMRTYNNLTVTYDLTSQYFYADDGSVFRLNVTDRFGNAIVINYTDYVSTFIDIQLTNIYSLKIQNGMRLPTLLNLTRNGVVQSQYAMAGEIVQYTLWNGTYQLNYTQSELNQSVSIYLDVTSAAIYNISTAYHTCYITVWSLTGDARAFTRLYINDTRRDFGFIEALGMTNVTVLDYINETQYSQVLDLSSFTERDIFVYLAHIGIQNLDRNQSAQVSVSKNGILLMSQQIGYGGWVDWYATNGTYDISFAWANGTMETRSQYVYSNNTSLGTFTLDFGHYEQELPPIDNPDDDTPDDGDGGANAWWTLGNVIGTIALVVGVILIIFAGIQTRKFRKVARILNTVNGM